MSSADFWTADRVWDALAERFDRQWVGAIRGAAASPDAAFDRAHDEMRAEVAALSGASGDINREEAKRRLIFAHVALAVLDALRRGHAKFRPVPDPRGNWAIDETALLLWAADHGGSDIRESHVHDREPGTPV